MLESAAGGRKDPQVDVPPGSGEGAAVGGGLAVFDHKGELSRVGSVRVRPGGLLEVHGLGSHVQTGDVDFQVSIKCHRRVDSRKEVVLRWALGIEIICSRG